MNDQKVSGLVIAVGGLAAGMGIAVPIAFVAGAFFSPSLAARWHKQEAAPVCICQSPRPEKVKLAFRSSPPGAQVWFADGSRAPKATPVEIEVPRDSVSFDVRLKLDGYKSETLEVRTDLDRDYLVSFEPEDKRSRHGDDDDCAMQLLTPKF